jgi:hypothetical protein
MIEFDFHNLRGILAQPAGSFKDARCLKAKKESGFTANYQGQGQSRNQRIGVSPAKTQRPQRKDRSELGVLGALAGVKSESEMSHVFKNLRNLQNSQP